MPICPKGHDSGTDDYCDQCGTPITGAAGPTAAPPSGAGGEGGGSGDEPTGQTCPRCGTPRAGRFCEVDGYDFVAADLGGGPPPDATGTTGDASANGPATGATDATATGTTGAGTAPTGPDGATGAAATGGGWRITLSADRAYHERVLALGGPDAAMMTFPPFYPERQFLLADGQLLIGRRSRSRGINPQIDLTGPPEDPGISHSHALLVPGTDGTWSVVDLDSANGTYLNDSTDAIAPNTPVTLHDGDRVHLGAWTTLTITNTH